MRLSLCTLDSLLKFDIASLRSVSLPVFVSWGSSVDPGPGSRLRGRSGPHGCHVTSDQPRASSWAGNIKLTHGKLWRTPGLEEFFSCQGGLTDGSASRNVRWVLVHLSGVRGDTSPSWAGVTCEPLLRCPLLKPGLVLAGVGGFRGLWEKARLRVSFLAWPNVFSSFAEFLRAERPHPTHPSGGAQRGCYSL